MLFGHLRLSKNINKYIIFIREFVFLETAQKSKTEKIYTFPVFPSKFAKKIYFNKQPKIFIPNSLNLFGEGGFRKISVRVISFLMITETIPSISVLQVNFVKG